MLKTDYIIYGILAVVVVGLVYAVWDFMGNDDPQVMQQANLNSGPAITTGNTDNGNVEIALEPKGITNGKFAVGITANTHSVALDEYGLKERTVLEYNGKKYKLVSAPNLAGHHTSGELVFDLGEVPENYKITISGIPSVPERIFEWG